MITKTKLEEFKRRHRRLKDKLMYFDTMTLREFAEYSADVHRLTLDITEEWLRNK